MDLANHSLKKNREKMGVPLSSMTRDQITISLMLLTSDTLLWNYHFTINKIKSLYKTIKKA